MASFDFIESATKSYVYVWDKRHELIGPSALVIGAKLLCFAVIFAFGLDKNILRQGLIMMPAYFVEGWMIAHIIFRAMRLEEDSGYKVAGLERINLKNVILSSTIIYVLTKLMLSFLIGAPFAIDPQLLENAESSASSDEETSAGIFIGLIAAFVFLAWGFRFLWLYIPPLLGINIQLFLIKIKPFKSSIYMLGLWALCFIPPTVLMGMSVQIISIPFPVVEGELPLTQQYVLSFIQGIFDYATVLIGSLGMAYGIASMMNDENKTVSLL